MSAKDLRVLIEASPFQPFSIVTSNDVLLRVSDKSFARINPDGSLEMWSTVDETMRRFPEGEIKQVIVDRTPSENSLQQLHRLRQLRQARPFVPFDVVLEDARRFRIDEPYYVAISPSSREICVAKAPAGFVNIPVAEIVEVKVG